MVITWYGENCFKLQSGDLVLVTDPFDKEIGLRPYRGRADIIIRTIVQMPSVRLQASSEADTFEINYPGEYEIKNVFIQGWPLTNSKLKTQNSKQLRTTYLVETDELKIVLLGYLSDESEIKDIREHLEDADIVFVPASGKPLIDQSAAAKLIRQLKPSLVIPALFDNFKSLKPFFKELGKNEIEPQEKLTFNKKEFSKEKIAIGCLKT